MELAQNNVRDLEEDLKDAKKQKWEMEDKLKLLMDSPFFKDYKERAETVAKIRSLEDDIRLFKQEIGQLKETNARYDAELKSRKKDLDDVTAENKKYIEEMTTLKISLGDKDKQLAPFKDLNYWDNDQFLKVLGNLKWTGEDPAWRKIEFIDRTFIDSEDPHLLRKEIEHLKLEKGELAAHLERT